MYEAQTAKAYADQQAMMNPAVETRRETEIDTEIRMLMDARDRLRETADALCARLTPVQRIGGSAKETPPAPVPTLCPLASALRDIRAALDSVSDVLQANRNQLEI